MKKSVEELLNELIQNQENKLLECAKALLPHLTRDDILQPNDYPEIDNHPFFRYEEGVLKGMHAVKMALSAWAKED